MPLCQHVLSLQEGSLHLPPLAPATTGSCQMVNPLNVGVGGGCLYTMPLLQRVTGGGESIQLLLLLAPGGGGGGVPMWAPLTVGKSPGEN